MYRLNLPRLDSNQNIFFSRQLEAIDDKDYETLFAGMLGRRYVPLIEGVPEWANVYTYRMYEMTGKAKIIGPGANDLPRVGVKATEASRVIKQIGTSYGWTVREIQQAAATGQPLDDLTVMAARSAAAREIDDLIAVGNSDFAIEGLLNITGVQIDAAGAKTGGGTTWLGAGATGDEILKDINTLIQNIRGALKQADAQVPQFARFTVLVPSEQYSKIATTARTSTSDTTILKYALQNNPWIESIEEWFKCDNAAAGGVTDRMVAYPRDPLWGGCLVPQEFTALAPQEEGLNIVVPATASCGGVVVRYPVAMRYMDGV
jgi:hypothetical protein